MSLAVTDGEQLHAAYDETAETIRRKPKLRQMAEKAGHTPDDAASEALGLFYKWREDHPDDLIENPAAWMVKAATNFIFMEHRAGVANVMPTDPTTGVLDARPDLDAEEFDELMDRRYNDDLFNIVLSGLETDDALLIAAAFREGLSSREVAKKYGRSAKTVQRAWRNFRDELAAETGEQGSKRTRSRAVAYVSGFMSAAQMQKVDERIDKGDWMLAMEVRRLQLGAEHAAALLPPVALGADRIPLEPATFQTAVAKVQNAATQLVGRGGDDAAVAGAGVGGASFATKAIVTVCAAGSAAGGVCVERGLVDLPGAGSNEPDKEQASDQPETPAPVAETPAPTPVPETTPIDQNAPDPTPKPAQQAANEFGIESGGGGSSSGSSSGGGEFGGAAPSGGGGGSRSGGGGGEFGIE